MKVNVYNKQKDLILKTPLVKKIVTAVIKLEDHDCDEVTIYFVDTKTICKLHADFFDDPSTTDCISFPLDDKDDDMPLVYKILGEVFVCPETAINYVAKNGGDPQHETILYVVHGLLHLMGYDDIDIKERSLMRKAEKKHMNHLKEINLLL